MSARLGRRADWNRLYSELNLGECKNFDKFLDQVRETSKKKKTRESVKPSREFASRQKSGLKSTLPERESTGEPRESSGIANSRDLNESSVPVEPRSVPYRTDYDILGVFGDYRDFLGLEKERPLNESSRQSEVTVAQISDSVSRGRFPTEVTELIVKQYILAIIECPSFSKDVRTLVYPPSLLLSQSDSCLLPFGRDAPCIQHSQNRIFTLASVSMEMFELVFSALKQLHKVVQNTITAAETTLVTLEDDYHKALAFPLFEEKDHRGKLRSIISTFHRGECPFGALTIRDGPVAVQEWVRRFEATTDLYRTYCTSLAQRVLILDAARKLRRRLIFSPRHHSSLLAWEARLGQLAAWKDRLDAIAESSHNGLQSASQ